MSTLALRCSSLLALTALPLAGCGAMARRSAGTDADSTARSRVVLSYPLPDLAGARLAMTLVEVRYGPGGRSAPHRHPCAVVGYVIEGALRSQVQGQTESTYTAGQSFYEAPDAIHLVSANASRERPVRFLAWFTCDHLTPLSSAVPRSDDSTRREP